tara:strand:+ start:2425 stop:3036 length:612 start_codon:yes stop_codon:yes gene_type:complete
MWWDILKNIKQTSKEVINLDWDEEQIPEEEDEKCKDRLQKLFDFLKTSKDLPFEYQAVNLDNGEAFGQHYIHGRRQDPYMSLYITAFHRGMNSFTEEAACVWLAEFKKVLDHAISHLDTPVNELPNSSNRVNAGEFDIYSNSSRGTMGRLKGTQHMLSAKILDAGASVGNNTRFSISMYWMPYPPAIEEDGIRAFLEKVRGMI